VNTLKISVVIKKGEIIVTETREKKRGFENGVKIINIHFMKWIKNDHQYYRR